jgi:hypothetical protein
MPSKSCALRQARKLRPYRLTTARTPAAKALGAKGGAARAKSMTPEKRAAIAKETAARRWQK